MGYKTYHETLDENQAEQEGITMGELSRIMTDLDFEELERLRAMEAKFQKASKINPDEIDTILNLRAGNSVVMTTIDHQALWNNQMPADLSPITNDEIETLKKLRNGDMIIIDADSITTAISGQIDEPFLAYLLRTLEWSTRTFGPAARTAGIIQHMQKEIGEIEKSPYDLTEWIDMIKLAIDGYWRHGGNLHMLLELMCRKQSKNMARTWPDWRTMSENVAIEHDRTGDI